MQLELFKNSLPKKPYCSNDLSHGLMVRNASGALSRRYIQHNHPNSKLWLAYDIDRATCIDEITDDRNLPCPTLFIQNKANGHAHALYALEAAVHINENSSTKALRFAAAVDTGLSSAIDADPNYVGLITKNPFHSHWQTYATGPCYDLHDLSEYVDLQKDRRKALENVGLGRNCNLFDSVRRAAYRAINDYRCNGQQRWESYVFDVTESHNSQLTAPLPFSEVKSIARSVAGWVWRYYTGTGRVKRDLAQNMNLNLQEKQVLSATITNRQQVERTRAMIKYALVRLQASGKKTTQKAVAELTGVSLRAVKMHWDLKR